MKVSTTVSLFEKASEYYTGICSEARDSLLQKFPVGLFAALLCISKSFNIFMLPEIRSSFQSLYHSELRNSMPFAFKKTQLLLTTFLPPFTQRNLSTSQNS